MRKLFYLFMIPALASTVLLTSCGKDDEDPAPTTTTPDACASETFPTSTGDATVDFLNLTSSMVQVEAGKVLSLAVEVTKGTNRTKKMKIHYSDCANTLGTEYDVSSQPNGGNKGIDLKSTTVQVRNVNFLVPTGFASTIYLTVEITEGGSNSSYHKLTLDVSGSGLFSTWDATVLGENGNQAASRMSSNTGEAYSSCDASENMDNIDITYRVNTTDFKSYICSNPARFTTPVGTSNDPNTASCDSSGNGINDYFPSTAGGNSTYFTAVDTSALNFDSAVESDLAGLAVTANDPEYIEIMNVGDVFAFMNSDNKKGLIKVVSATGFGNNNTSDGTITVSVKVQQ